MKTKIAKKIKESNISALKDVIVDAILDKKGEDVVSLDLTKLGDSVTDMFIICHASARVQVKAIADNIIDKTKELIGEVPIHKEGYENQEWIIVDYFNIVVHIFLQEKREFYQLEDLWSDAELTDYD